MIAPPGALQHHHPPFRSAPATRRGEPRIEAADSARPQAWSVLCGVPGGSTRGARVELPRPIPRTEGTVTAVQPRHNLPTGLAAPPSHVPTVAPAPIPLPVAEGESRLLVERTRLVDGSVRSIRRKVLAYLALTKP